MEIKLDWVTNWVKLSVRRSLRKGVCSRHERTTKTQIKSLHPAVSHNRRIGYSIVMKGGEWLVRLTDSPYDLCLHISYVLQSTFSRNVAHMVTLQKEYDMTRYTWDANFMTYVQQRLRSTFAHQSLPVRLKNCCFIGSSHTRPAKALISLRGRAGWSEFSLGDHGKRCIFTRFGQY